MRFEQRVVVITGVGRRGQMGEEVARAFADAGARVALVSRTTGEGEARAVELRGTGLEARAFAAELSDEAQVQALADAVRAAYDGRVDALVHVAGGFAMSGPVGESDVAVWRRQIDINLTTAYLVTRAFVPLLRATRGSIVYFASAAALPGATTARMAAYAVAKSGVVALMHAVAQEERANGVRANAVAPTAIRTADNVSAMGEDAAYVERGEVASAVCWLCSDEASGVTGQVLRLA